ncbi:hypothetical protein BpHYR1_003551 [Brachionus plicatilis]|uniref:Uncharacterized protein n=1 Tax=Brachionus plicatilis TaxID=10195 RepID=A0A3M7QD69_BRAPC|nr:hypothetical protein BpHYR1_003551 [Brachionus plicatilis]
MDKSRTGTKRLNFSSIFSNISLVVQLSMLHFFAEEILFNLYQLDGFRQCNFLISDQFSKGNKISFVSIKSVSLCLYECTLNLELQIADQSNGTIFK